MAKIFVVDDDIELCKSIIDRLALDQHTTEFVHNGKEAEDQLRVYSYDCIVLDWNLPGLEGPDICRNFRRRGGKTPILLLTGRHEIQDRETGLDSGADDYLIKPFSVRELAARVRALLRRPAAPEPKQLSIGDLCLDTVTREVKVDGKPVHLRPKEFAVLELLMNNRGHVFSVDALVSKLWGGEPDVTIDSVRATLTRLRQKIDSPSHGSIIMTVHGLGYKIEAN